MYVVADLRALSIKTCEFWITVFLWFCIHKITILFLKEMRPHFFFYLQREIWDSSFFRTILHLRCVEVIHSVISFGTVWINSFRVWDNRAFLSQAQLLIKCHLCLCRLHCWVVVFSVWSSWKVYVLWRKERHMRSVKVSEEMKMRIIIELKQKGWQFSFVFLVLLLIKWKLVLCTPVYYLLFFCVVLKRTIMFWLLRVFLKVLRVPLFPCLACSERDCVSIWCAYPEYFHCLLHCVQQANWIFSLIVLSVFIESA